ncbi:MAG: ATP-binding cassette domain-containing protein [Synergistaceae bacterium]|jgi:peptide/nickel transport system ATP-binding protein|nr:ATP-binding cassette domain-containing protein [Synergistaceae bacterium]
MTAILKTTNLKKYFKIGNNGFLHAVDGVDIELERGTTLGVVGESGCGKSTLGRLVLGLLPATSGEIYYDGVDIMHCGNAELAECRRKTQIIFQDPYSSLNPRMSVYELISEPLVSNKAFRNKAERYARVMELMDTVGLAERFINSYPHEMDGGRRQRVGVARALALKPDFIVCDEPVSALDVSIQAQILNLLMDMQDEMNLTYMFITHDLSVVRHISNEIMVMYLGQCVERSPSKELFRNPAHPYTQALLSAIPAPVLGGFAPEKLLRGEISDPINPEPGCRFAKRCSQCGTNCVGKDVPLEEIEPGHFVACTLFTQKGGMPRNTS